MVLSWQILFGSILASTDSDPLYLSRASDRLGPAKRLPSGAVDYISVPIVPALLRAKISVFVELHRVLSSWRHSM